MTRAEVPRRDGGADLQQLDGRDEHRDFLGEPLARRPRLRQPKVKVHNRVHRVIHRGVP